MPNTNTNPVVSASAIAELDAKTKELTELRKAKKAREDRAAWEAKTKARNPAYILGSLLPADDRHVAELGHSHGWVCSIVCERCGKVRNINKQDAFQVRFCKDCKVETRKEKAKAQRLQKKVEGKSVEEIQAEIDALNAEINTDSDS